MSMWMRNYYFYPQHYVEEKVTVKWPAMRSFRAENFPESSVGIIIDGLYNNKEFQDYIETLENSCKNQVLTATGPGEESMAVLIDDFNRVLHGSLEIIEKNGAKGDAFELTIHGLDDPRRIHLTISPKKIKFTK